MYNFYRDSNHLAMIAQPVTSVKVKIYEQYSPVPTTQYVEASTQTTEKILPSQMVLDIDTGVQIASSEGSYDSVTDALLLPMRKKKRRRHCPNDGHLLAMVDILTSCLLLVRLAYLLLDDALDTSENIVFCVAAIFGALFNILWCVSAVRLHMAVEDGIDSVRRCELIFPFICVNYCVYFGLSFFAIIGCIMCIVINKPNFYGLYAFLSCILFTVRCNLNRYKIS